MNETNEFRSSRLSRKHAWAIIALNSIVLLGILFALLVLFYVRVNHFYHIDKAALLPLPSPLVVLGDQVEDCGGNGDGDDSCSLSVAIRHSDAKTDPAPLLRDHLLSRGWMVVAELSQFPLEARRKDLCLDAEYVDQIPHARDRLAALGLDEVRYGLTGGLAGATDRPLLVVTVHSICA